jgi:hypothetical protein
LLYNSPPKNIKIEIYKNTILLLVLHECNTLPVTLRKEHRRRLLENRLLRRILGPKRDKN